MPTAPGYANCAYELKHGSMTRSAFITFGINPTDTDPVLIANKLANSFAHPGSLFSVIDDGVTLVSTRVSLGTDGTEDIVGASSTLVACSRAMTSHPPNCAVLVHKLTARGGRRGRGRWYIPWAGNWAGANEAGAIAPGDITAVSAACTVWHNDVTSDIGPPVVLHRPSAPGTEHPTTPGAPNQITGYRVDPLTGTQRRRIGR